MTSEEAEEFCRATCQAASLHGWKIRLLVLDNHAIAFEWRSPEGKKTPCRAIPARDRIAAQEALFIACDRFREINA